MSGLFLILTLAGQSVAAQGLDTLGTRASAMAAFVAVADDASAVAWNPAGLVHGPIFNVLLDLGRSTALPSGPPADAAGPARRAAGTVVAFAAWPVGVSYYRLHSTVVTPAELGSSDRQDRQVVVRSLTTTNLAATVVQSLGDHLTAGATVRLVRGHASADAGVLRSWDAAFDRAEALEARGTTTGDIDAGLMFETGRFRAGLVARNLTAPTFALGANGTGPVTIARYARAGVAWGDRWPGISRLVIAVDADLTRTADGAVERDPGRPRTTIARRDIAAGIERWFRGQRIGVRGGVRASTIGDPRPVVSLGGSYAVRGGTYLDAYLARGRANDRAWGAAARVTY